MIPVSTTAACCVTLFISLILPVLVLVIFAAKHKKQGIVSAWLKEQDVSRGWKIFVVFACITICMSTMFIKQHSAVDFFAALPVGLLAEIIAYGKDYWKPKLTPQKGTAT